MSGLQLPAVPEDDLKQLRADAEAHRQPFEDYMLDRIHELAAGARKRRKLAEIAAKLKTMPPSNFTVEDVLAAKDAPRRGLA